MQPMILTVVWLVAAVNMALAFAWLAGAGALLLPSAFALWLLAAVATLRKGPRLWPVVLAVPVFVYGAVYVASVLLAMAVDF